MKKILISDYDATYFTKEKDVLKNVEKTIEFREKGNLFVIATSRSFYSIKKEIIKYKIPCDYIFCNIGAGIFDGNQNKIYANYVQSEDRKIIENILASFSEKKLIISRYGIQEDQLPDSKKVIGYKVKGEEGVLVSLKEVLEQKVTGFDILLKEKGKLFLNNQENTKEKAISNLLKLLYPEKYEVITVGDDDVDFGMIEKYHGYRMEKSSELLEKNINRVVKSVRELM